MHALKLDSKSHDIYTSLAVIMEMLNKQGDAQQMYKYAIELNPMSHALRMQYINLLTQSGECTSGQYNIKLAGILNT